MKWVAFQNRVWGLSMPRRRNCALSPEEREKYIWFHCCAANTIRSAPWWLSAAAWPESLREFQGFITGRSLWWSISYNIKCEFKHSAYLYSKRKGPNGKLFPVRPFAFGFPVSACAVCSPKRSLAGQCRKGRKKFSQKESFFPRLLLLFSLCAKIALRFGRNGKIKRKFGKKWDAFCFFHAWIIVELLEIALWKLLLWETVR